MISFRTGAKALAAVAGVSLALSACASSSSGGAAANNNNNSNTTAPITFTYGHEQEYSAYNVNTADGNSIANTVVTNQTIRGFYYFAPNGDVTPDKDFGTFEKTSDTPLTIKYTINPKAAWSDGNAFDCDDMVLMWLANSGLTGAKGFKSASTAGYEDMNKPQCKDGDKTVTIVYKKTFSDWNTLFGSGMMPAHIVEQNSGLPDIIAAADTPTSPTLAKAENFYNTAWQLNPGELKPNIMPALGPYSISKWTAGQSITLTANPKWWGQKPKAQTIVIRFIAGDQEVQALQNGEIDAMDPQPQVEIVNQLKALGSKVKFTTADQYTFEHLDFNLQGEFKDKKLREAFAKCVPRQQIVENLVKPQNPNAKILESRFIFPFQDAYSQFATGVGGNAYDQVDLPGAKALLGGKTGIKVNIGWRKDPAALNKRRADTIALLQASCNQVGFKVVDDGTADFFDKQLPNGSYDVAMFAWTGSPALSSNYGLYVTGGDSNYGKYSNPKVDKDLSAVNSELDPAKRISLVKDMDTQLWTDLYTIPLFAFPGIEANDPSAEGVVYNATQQELTWNAYDWSIKS